MYFIVLLLGFGEQGSLYVSSVGVFLSQWDHTDMRGSGWFFLSFFFVGTCVAYYQQDNHMLLKGKYKTIKSQAATWVHSEYYFYYICKHFWHFTASHLSGISWTPKNMWTCQLKSMISYCKLPELEILSKNISTDLKITKSPNYILVLESLFIILFVL